MRIHSLSYRNYRAFSGEGTIEFNGKNQLVYGENGSGKSSLSQAFIEVIATLGNFQNAGDVNFENRFVESAERGTAWLSFSTQDAAGAKTDYRIDQATPPDLIMPAMTTAMNRSRRLSYQDIWSILYSRTQRQVEIEKPNVFEYLVRFLGTAEVPTPAFPEINELEKEQTELYRQRNRIARGETIEEGVETPETLEQQQIRFRARVETYLENVKSIVSSVEARANSFLQYFYPEVSFSIEFPAIENIFTVSTENKLDWRFDHIEVAHLKIFYHSQEMDMADVFLNEARLNALGLCIFLAGMVELSPAPNPDDLHLLVLDDVLIGLDMGNRIPLLKVLTEAEVPYTTTNADGETETHHRKAFEHYQLILTTYDRAWFQAAKRWLNLHTADKWEYKEMYAHRHFDRTVTPARYLYDIPVIRESYDHLASALRFMNDRDFPDYPSAANYLRKASEEMIKTYLPRHEFDVTDINTDGSFKNIMLDTLLEKSLNFYEKLPHIKYFNNENLIKIKDLYLKILLNPFSHHDLGSAIYREELEKAFEVIKDFEAELEQHAQRCRVLLPPTSEIRIEFPMNGKIGYVEIVLDSAVYVYDTPEGIMLSTCKFASGTTYDSLAPGKQDRANYVRSWNSIEEAYQGIVEHWNSKGEDIHLLPYYIAAIRYKGKEQGMPQWNPLQDLLERRNSR